MQSYLLMVADLREIPRADQQVQLSDAIYATGLADHLTRPIGELSKGFRQRVGLAQAILHRPKLLILDEPTVELDPTQIVEIRNLIRRLSRDSTILFSSHILSEVEAVCDRVIIIMNGEVEADARLADLATSNDAILVLQNETANVEQMLKTLPGVQAVTPIESAVGRPIYRITGQTDTELNPGGDPDRCAHQSWQLWGTAAEPNRGSDWDQYSNHQPQRGQRWHWVCRAG